MTTNTQVLGGQHVESGRVAGKVAVITGAGSRGEGYGTGKAIAISLAREGASVCLVDRNVTAAEETASEIRSSGGAAIVVGADVTAAGGCNDVAQAAVEQFGGVDLLVNNVGISDGGHFDVVTEELWDHVVAVNLKSVFLMSKAVVPLLRRRGGGAILNISSIAGLLSIGVTPYGATKAGVIMLSRDMAHDLGPDNIRVNVIAPGHIFTPMVSWKTSQQERDLRRDIAPLGVEGNAWDVAEAALFLLSDESRFISGVVLPVDGGATQILAKAGVQLARKRGSASGE